MGLQGSRKRLVFDEYYKILRDIRELKNNRKKLENNFIITPSEISENLILNLPYKLTDAQKKYYLN
jgi:RecG-like helicase